MFPKGRVEALTDGIFAVAMTLLVLDLRLPESLVVHNQADLLDALSELLPKFLPYLLSFYVLGKDWLALSELQSMWNEMSRSHAKWTLTYLLLVTLVPFSTTIMGRYGQFPLAACLYLVNLAAVAFIFHLLLPRKGDPVVDGQWVDKRIDTLTFVGTCVLAGVLSFYYGAPALLVLMLNAFVPRAIRRMRRAR